MLRRPIHLSHSPVRHDSVATGKFNQRDFGQGRYGRHRDGGRHFEHGRLRFVLLQLIAAKPAHGYELIKAIEEQTDGAYSSSPGVIYSTLTLLEELNYVSVVASAGSRKLYSITADGRKHLDEQQPALDEMSRRAKSRRSRRDDLPLPILRGLENLKMTLRLRLQQGEISMETSCAVAAELDRATQNIEQLQA